MFDKKFQRTVKGLNHITKASTQIYKFVTFFKDE